MLKLAGATVTELRVAVVVAVTVAAEVPLLPPEVAVIVAEPPATPVARPAVTVAMPLALEVQVAVAVRSWVLPSLYCPVAVSWRLNPTPRLKLAGVTDTELRVAVVVAVTVRAQLLLMAPTAAMMVVEPALAPVARPLVLTVATPVALEDQVAVLLRSVKDPSL